MYQRLQIRKRLTISETASLLKFLTNLFLVVS